ncbi:MAG TPA: diguanylate cyclase [Rhodocyclaceae bacterium]|nr:diguanylate cyclase [Rhodocyclaceae bacterium]
MRKAIKPRPNFNVASAIRGGIFLIGLLTSLVAVQSAEPERTFHVGITAFRDKSVTSREWTPTMDYLSTRIPGAKFEAVPLNLAEFQDALSKKELDFVITNPEHYIVMESQHGVSRVATLMKRENGKIVNRFGGVVFTRNDRPDIRRLEDVKGKTIASVDRTSFAGFLLQYDLIQRHGVDVLRDSTVSFLGFPQDLSVKAVLNREADVGFVRTGVLEAMANEGKISIGQIRVLNPAPLEGFPFRLSTDLYPEWPLAAAPQVPVEITNQVAAALLLMPPDSPAAQAARYYRWSTPLEYQSVQNLMRRHHIYPYDKREPITLAIVLKQYAAPILLILSILTAGIVVLYVRARRLNKDLHFSRQQLSDLAHHDALTGLPNRNMLDHDLEKAIAHTLRGGDELAVCLLDLDSFKPINDRWGHEAGDKVLREISTRLQSILRAGDTVARWGGDEFVLLLGITDRVQLDEILRRVLSAVSAPLTAYPETTVDASIGVCLFPSDTRSESELFRRADEAMYWAKKSGGNRFALWAQGPDALTVTPKVAQA